MNLDKLINMMNRSNQHKYLYHFTDEANFPSISAKGLISKERMRAEGWWPPLATGGNPLSHDLDTYRGIDPYVSLCMTRNHRMKFLAQKDGRLPNPRYLAIRPEVLKIEGTRIAFGVANANDVEILPVEEAILKLDVEVLYERTEWSDPTVQQRLQAAEKLEVLVPHTVPVELLAGVF
ncbi:DUF4433 domain-containing protein [Fulvimarina endophytica]|uniref:DUF4433 domain-containing protein n=1 Tax=Fulvimarina endophytica TaxID=2293836 RepID=A0A371X581_9HYPH|nr:DarT ssDNA thymidine ADP-ribosyltransferase family protein [Fulvimarina endophytica]RFC64372.1 DUF4433 domain-containing protein [Fulvimarina endophytica]